MNIVVGVTGGIAAYKTVHLVRLLTKGGHDVTVVPTEDALRFVGLPTWEAISRHPVTTSVHDDVAKVRHVALGQAAELVIVAPATANSIAKITAGLADDLLGTTLLATEAPVLLAPAMHAEMWRNRATQANIATLRERGVHLVGPADGELAGGDSGPGRMSEPEEIFAAAQALLTPGDLAGVRVVVSAGGTREPIDPVRFLGNRSSGRQGVALAAEAAARGAEVTLVSAHISGDVLAEARHPSIRIVPVGAAADLAEAMTRESEVADVVVMAAAVADYRPVQVSERKLTKEGGGVPAIDLIENEDIVASLAAARRPGQLVVGFAAETPEDQAEMLARARGKQQRKGVDVLVVNEVGWERGFESVENAVHILGPGGVEAGAASGSKRAVAAAIWGVIAEQRVLNLSQQHSTLIPSSDPAGGRRPEGASPGGAHDHPADR
ncbi:MULTISPECIES: bifunctional phosphopantothenoylcysteine decarboxylase/phosphopantothenate--cysteine ligase CoaBC [Microbacterium]|uniref:Coenzyme A biosynthesis bifunctional protein CoaBC n=2 Tax=Microbacterium maritypicum TaxID=33918 RepID=A0AAJ5VAM9_MICMQ|nr:MULTISPECIES: bifunctional phosphopantothenoylcysteine decarboxylase/phosphopantothenate--cysteine ligase CoaBC [Microbacterium]EYT60404.1 phosphopantothenoylcysteine decarboxylase [Microbacterium sp. UCD-TDU]MBP5801627.1 bifunctional phosphopantothenoylcysteine decarboxylase/phosphopantothenate--cysteine ligase CoaBC [Microbacterium liquefaciens]UTT52691.1 bifunctional phosphopantothenoylcysteine decarboxylase/phosphopantothenate--cysteine ligase CoaBC [Microbacterium liquefaciens]WEF20736.